jgi:hypothetical protein
VREGLQRSLKRHAHELRSRFGENSEILEPTFVISHGWGLVDTLWESLAVDNQVDLNLTDCYLADCELTGNRIRMGGAQTPGAALEFDRPAIFQGFCRSCNRSGAQAGAEARAGGVRR